MSHFSDILKRSLFCVIIGMGSGVGVGTVAIGTGVIHLQQGLSSHKDGGEFHGAGCIAWEEYRACDVWNRVRCGIRLTTNRTWKDYVHDTLHVHKRLFKCMCVVFWKDGSNCRRNQIIIRSIWFTGFRNGGW